MDQYLHILLEFLNSDQARNDKRVSIEKDESATGNEVDVVLR